MTKTETPLSHKNDVTLCQQDVSAHTTLLIAWQLEFNPRNPHKGEMGEATSQACPLSPCICHGTLMFTYIHQAHTTKVSRYIFKSIKKGSPPKKHSDLSRGRETISNSENL